MGDYYNTIKSAEEKGEARSHEEGLIEGRAEGRAERTLEIARNMKRLNIPVADIKEMTGLSEAEIERI